MGIMTRLTYSDISCAGYTTKVRDMSFRGSKGVKLYHNGELCAEMGSVKATVDLLVLHDPKQRSWGSVQKLFKEARKNNTELFGFTFFEDPSWVPSRGVMATDVETNETFVQDSVGEMARVVFGPDDICGTKKICRLCRNGKSYKGLVFNHVNENDGYHSGYGNRGVESEKPVQQLDIGTDDVINEFPSVNHAGFYIWNTGLSGATSVKSITSSISMCVNNHHCFPNKNYLGYKWQFKP